MKGITYHSAEKFERIKSGIANQIQKRLDFLRFREEKLERPIHGLEVERELQFVASRCGVRDEALFHGIATVIDHSFGIEQKKLLYEILNDIRENIPWEGIDWYAVFDRNSKGRDT